MVVQHNITAMNANRYFGINNSKLSKSLEKLSSGYAINRAGDNAAGLAVSEKMRSQIAGMTQGVKNAQDGISMIQTYEGALTETDNILQRMKTLADQAAHGTYQDEVDREAIQLEFNQLNDELNQIADTDFNGVVLLNGGQMADGVKAIDGKFDYANRTPKELSAKDVTKLDWQLFDDADDTNGLTKADKIWNTVSGGAWDRKDPTKSAGPDYVDVELQYNSSDKTWSVKSASNGAIVGQFEVSDLEATDGGSKNGGFILAAGGESIANVVIDESKLVNGDTIKLRLNNPSNGTVAPKNVGAEIIDNTVTEKSGADDIKKQDMNLTSSVSAANLTDAKMTKDLKKLLDAFNGATLSYTYKDGTAATDGSDLLVKLNGEGEIDGKDIATGKKLTLSDGTEYWAEWAGGKLTISTVNVDAAGDELFSFELTKPDTDKNQSAGTVTWQIGFEHYNFDDTKTPSVEVVNSNASNVSNSNTYGQATAPLTYTDHLIMQVGARSKDAVDFTFKYASDGLGDLKANMNCSARADGLGTANLSLLDQKSANAAIDKIDNAINKVSMVRGTFGAVQNRLEHKIDNMNVTIENLTSAESRIRDTNMAEEMMNFTKQQILSQASQSMLAQANQLPQSVLQLLQ